jgi:ankyrin repeat protein
VFDPFNQTPLYPSHALFEATRAGHVELMQLLLAEPSIDANLPAVRARTLHGLVVTHARPSLCHQTAAGITALADCTARGRWDLAKVLLDSGKVTHTIGSAVKCICGR